jgi:hypothetical protein
MQVNGIASKVILLLTPVDMGRNSAGQLYLSALMATTPSIRVVNARLPESGYLEYLPGAGWLSRALTSLASRLGAWQTLKLVLYERRQLPCDTLRAKEWRQSYGAESVWVTLSSPESILLAYSLIQCGLKLRVTVWDAPEQLLRSLNIGRKSAKWVMKTFAAVLRGATSVSVISTNMQLYYEAQYGIAPIVIRPVAAMPAFLQHATRRRRTLRVVFAGSLYAKTEWNALLKSLAAQQWRIAEKRVVIYFLGAFPLRGADYDRHVKRLGHRSSEEAAKISKKCDVAYLPYWLSDDRELVAATSFPSKLATYLSSGLPVLNHGPRTSEVTRIMCDHAIGISCHSLAVDEISSALKTLVQPANLMAMRQAIPHLVQYELSPEAVGRKFAEFMAE